MLGVFGEALKEAAASERVASSQVFGGLFRVTRRVTISEFVRRILAAVLADTGDIEIDGIIIHRPGVIQITMTGFRSWKMTPAMPISVKMLGTDVAFDISSVELIRDEDTGGPGVLVTTSSSIKPNVLIVFGVAQPDPAVPSSGVPSADEIQKLLKKHGVPSQHKQVAETAVKEAFGPRRIAVSRMAASQGNADSKMIAKQIVQDLVEQRVVSMGFLFWFRLGYWLVKIIAALIEARRGTAE